MRFEPMGAVVVAAAAGAATAFATTVALMGSVALSLRLIRRITLLHLLHPHTRSPPPLRHPLGSRRHPRSSCPFRRHSSCAMCPRLLIAASGRLDASAAAVSPRSCPAS